MICHLQSSKPCKILITSGILNLFSRGDQLKHSAGSSLPDKMLRISFQSVSHYSLLQSSRHRLGSTSACAALPPPRGGARSLWSYLSSPRQFPGIAGLEHPLWAKERDFVRKLRRWESRHSWGLQEEKAPSERPLASVRGSRKAAPLSPVWPSYHCSLCFPMG